MHSNPFTYGNPISESNRFFRRGRELDQVSAGFATQNSNRAR